MEQSLTDAPNPISAGMGIVWAVAAARLGFLGGR